MKRLVKPYSLEQTKSLLTLGMFRPLVSQCRSSGIYQVREIAAKAFASLLSPDDIVSEVKALISEVSELHATFSPNELHGILLQIEAIVSSPMFKDVLRRRDGMS